MEPPRGVYYVLQHVYAPEGRVARRGGSVVGTRRIKIASDLIAMLQVSRYLDAPDIITGNTSPMDPAVKQRLLRHLDSCVSELDLDLGSRPDSGLGSSPGSVTDRVTGAASPGPLEHHVPPAAHCSTTLNSAATAGLVKAEIPEIESARPDSSTIAGDENNNNSSSSGSGSGNSRPTSAFGQLNTASLESHHHSHPSLPPPPPSAHPSTAGIPAVIDHASSPQQNPNMLSVVQVIPSRLPDGQVVFLLPSHYVQLAAAAAANGISIGPNPPTAIWAATNMSLLKATDKLAKRPHDDSIQEWQDAAASVAVNAAAAAAAAVAAVATSASASVSASVSASAPAITNFSTNVMMPGPKPSKSPRLEQPEQPLDFTTTSKKLKTSSRTSMPVVVNNVDHHAQQQQFMARLSAEGSITHVTEDRPSSHASGEFVSGIRSPSPTPHQSVKDEEGMWRPW